MAKSKVRSGLLEPEDIPERMLPHSGYGCDVPWEDLDDWIRRQEKHGLDMNPDYQRGHVWTEDQQRAFVEYVLCGGETSRTLVFAQIGKGSAFATTKRTADGGFVYPGFSILDGKQRCEAIRRLVAGEFRVFSRPEKLEGYLWSELGNGFRSWVSTTIRVVIVTLPSRKAILATYLKFNGGGTPHTAEELARSRALYDAEPG